MLKISYKIPPPPRVSVFPRHAIEVHHSKRERQREAKALEMILRGLTVTGPSAHEIGMVHEVVDDPLARALEIAAELASRGAEGLAQAKRLTRAAFDRPLADGLVDERRSFGSDEDGFGSGWVARWSPAGRYREDLKATWSQLRAVKKA